MVLHWLRSLFGKRDVVPDASASGADYFVYVKIPEDLGPLDRGAKYEDPIDAKLEAGSLGKITGGGSQLGDGPNGEQVVEFCGIDIGITDLEPGLTVLRDTLIELAAPIGTELHYEDGSEKLQDELSPNGWVLRRPRSFLHPGFGI